MVKFKVKFTIPAETLFGLLAKVLPIEDLHVEELVERPTPAALSQIAQRVISGNAKTRRKRAAPMDLNNGVNGVIMRHLAEGKPHRANEMKPLLLAAGFSANSGGSRLAMLAEHGHVFQPELGLWQLVQQLQQSASTHG